MFKRCCRCLIPDNKSAKDGHDDTNKIVPENTKLNESIQPLNGIRKISYFKSSPTKDDSLKTVSKDGFIDSPASLNNNKSKIPFGERSKKQSGFKNEFEPNDDNANNSFGKDQKSDRQAKKNVHNRTPDFNSSQKSFIRIEQHNSFNINLPNGNQNNRDLTINITTKQKNMKQCSKQNAKKMKSQNDLTTPGLLKKHNQNNWKNSSNLSKSTDSTIKDHPSIGSLHKTLFKNNNMNSCDIGVEDLNNDYNMTNDFNSSIKKNNGLTCEKEKSSVSIVGKSLLLASKSKTIDLGGIINGFRGKLSEENSPKKKYVSTCDLNGNLTPCSVVLETPRGHKEKGDSVDAKNNSGKKSKKGEDWAENTLRENKSDLNTPKYSKDKEVIKIDTLQKQSNHGTPQKLKQSKCGVNQSLSDRSIKKAIIKTQRKYTDEHNSEESSGKKLNKSCSLDSSTINDSPCANNISCSPKKHCPNLCIDVQPRNEISADGIQSSINFSYRNNMFDPTAFNKSESIILTPLTRNSTFEVDSATGIRKKSNLRKTSMNSSKRVNALDNMSSTSDTKTVFFGESNVSIVENYKDFNSPELAKIDPKLMDSFVEKFKARSKFSNINKVPKSNAVENLSKGLFSVVKRLQQKNQELPEIAEESMNAEESIMKKKKKEVDNKNSLKLNKKRTDRSKYDLSK